MAARTALSLAAEAAFLARLAEEGATLLEDAWLGTNTPHKVRCAAGHECAPSPSNVRKGHGVCWTCHVANRPRLESSIVAEAAFRASLAAMGATLLEDTYLGSRTAHRVRCAASHQCSPSPGGMQAGHAICSECSAANRPRLRSSIIAEAAFRASLAAMGATLLEDTYLGSHTPHRVRCAAGHQCSPYPADIQQGQGICSVCARCDPATAEAAFRASLAAMGATLLEDAWLGSNTPHRVRCRAGHTCWPRPNSVQQGGGICSVCAQRDPATAEAAFRASLAAMGATLLEDAWLGSRTRHRVRCAAGHTCWPRPNSVQQGNGICWYCAGRKWDTFYVVADVQAARLKLGISSNGGRRRLTMHRRAGYRDVVRLLTGLQGDTAADIEGAALTVLRLAGVQPVRGREYYDASALGVVLDVVDNYPMG